MASTFRRFAFSVLPTLAVPLIRGVAAVSVPALSFTAAEVLETATKPPLAPSTETVIDLPCWAVVSVKVELVAPGIALPSANH